MAYTNSYALASDEAFLDRLEGAVVYQAKIVDGEASPDPKRLGLARAAYSDPAGVSRKFATPIAVDSTVIGIYEGADNDQGAIQDATLDTLVASLWNDIAGV